MEQKYKQSENLIGVVMALVHWFLGPEQILEMCSKKEPNFNLALIKKKR